MYCTYTRNIKFREKNFAQKCKKYYLFWVSVTLIIQHAKCMRSIVLCCVVICGLSQSTTFLYITRKRHNIRQKVNELKMYVFYFHLKHYSF